MMHPGTDASVIAPAAKSSRLRNIAIALIAATALLIVGAASADAATRLVTTSGGTSGSCSVTPCTIPYAITVADPGDTISIADGSYTTATNISVPKNIQFVGQSRGGTLIGPDTGTVNQPNFVLSDNADGTTFSDLTVRSRHTGHIGAIQVPAGLAGSVDDIGITNVTIDGISSNSGDGINIGDATSGAAADDWVLDDVAINEFLGGIWNQGLVTDMSITDSSFALNDNGIYAANQPGQPTQDGVFNGFTITDTDFDQNDERGLYFEGLSNANFSGLNITDTGANIAPGPGLPFGARGIAINLKDGVYSNINIEDSTVHSSVYEGITIEVRGWTGDSGTYTAAPASLAGLTLDGLTLTGNGGPGLTIANRNTISTTPTIVNSRITGNGFLAGPGVNGVAKDGNGPVDGVFPTFAAPTGIAVDAINNWWGCNEGPTAGGPDCDTTQAPADGDPWLIADATSGPLAFPGSVPIDVTINTNSDNNAAGPAPAGTPVDYVSLNPDRATVAPGSDPLDGSGASQTTVTAQDTGPVGINATVDNEDFEFVFTITGPAATRYVATTGNDTNNNCRTMATPCLTVQHAVNRATSGDTIQVAAGTYTGQTLVSDKNLTVDGEGDTTVLKATQAQMAVLGDSTRRPVLGAFGGNADLDVTDLKIDGDAAGDNNGQFVGFGLRTASGSLDNVTIVDIRQPFFSPGPAAAGQRQPAGSRRLRLRRQRQPLHQHQRQPHLRLPEERHLCR